MDTQGIDQMLSVLRATAAQAGGRAADAPASAAGGTDFAQVLQSSIAQVNQTQQEAESMAAKFAAGDGNTNLHEVMISLQQDIQTVLEKLPHDVRLAMPELNDLRQDPASQLPGLLAQSVPVLMARLLEGPLPLAGREP